MTNIETTSMIDITDPDEGVEILITEKGKKLWVNVDGICRLRIYKCKKIVINDERKKDPKKDMYYR